MNDFGTILRNDEERRDLRRLGYLLGIACLMIIIWPPSNPEERYWSQTTWHVGQDQMVPAERANAEADAVVKEAQQTLRAGTLTVEKIVSFQKRLVWLESHAEQHGPNPRPGKSYVHQIHMSGFAEVRRIFLTQWDREKDRLNSQTFSDYLGADPEYKAAQEFKASTTESNAWQVAGRYVIRYLLTLPLGFLLCVITYALAERKKFGFAAVMIMNHPKRIVLYPIGIIACAIGGPNYDDYRRNTKRLVSALGYATAASMSLFSGGVAMAQTVKKETKKKDKSFSLQLDTRVIGATDGPPLVFNRATFNGKGWAIDNISTDKPATGSWYNELGIARRIVKTSRTTVNLGGVFSTDSGGTQKVMAGVQYFRAGPRSVIAVPAARLEKTVGGPWAMFFAGNPLFKFGRDGIASRFALSPDISGRKTLGKPFTWTAGLGLVAFPRKGKGDRTEVALLRTSAAQWQIRGRWIVNFAF